jgi:hypothetical protein
LSKLGRAVELGATGETDVDLVLRLTAPEPPRVEPPLSAPTEALPPTSMPLPSGPIMESTIPPAEECYESFDPLSLQEHCDADEFTVSPTEERLVNTGGEVNETTTQPPGTPQPESEEDEAEVPARVPWRTYDSRPSRQAPPRTRPSTPAESEPAKDVPDEDLPRPLLTEEELRALIGDDPMPLSPDDVDHRRDRP